MNCERYQEKINDALAAAESALSGDLAAHLGTCAECLEFYEAQRRLFAAIDSSLRVMVNEEAAASLLPRVRARMSEAPSPLFVWKPAWSVVAASTVLIAISTASVTWHRSGQDAGLRSVSSKAPKVIEVPPAVPAPTEVIHAADNSRVGRSRTTVFQKEPEAPEVIMPAEEREAFARFASKIPANPQAAMTLAYPAPAQQVSPVEIALLQIETMKMDLLEPTAEE